MLKMWWIWKIEIWCEELVDGYQTVPYQPGALIWGGQLNYTLNFTPIHVYPRLNEHHDPRFFFQVFAKNSLIKNIPVFEEEKKFDSRTWFFLENSSNWVYFWQDEDFKLTTELPERVQYCRNQAIKNGLNEAILLISINEALLSRQNFGPFKKPRYLFCMKVLQTLNAQPVKISHFKSLPTRKQARWPHFFIAFL